MVAVHPLDDPGEWRIVIGERVERAEIVVEAEPAANSIERCPDGGLIEIVPALGVDGAAECWRLHGPCVPQPETHGATADARRPSTISPTTGRSPSVGGKRRRNASACVKLNGGRGSSIRTMVVDGGVSVIVTAFLPLAPCLHVIDGLHALGSPSPTCGRGGRG